MTQSEQIALDDIAVELPPHVENLLLELKRSQKELLRTKDFGEKVQQLRGFAGLHMYAQIIKIVKLFGAMFVDCYSIAVSNANQLQRMQSFVVRELQKLGADVDDEAPLPGVSNEVIDEFQQAFFAVGAKLNEKLPEDAEMQKVWNRCAEMFSDMVRDLMGMTDDDSDYEDGDEDEDDEEESSAEISEEPVKDADSDEKSEEKPDKKSAKSETQEQEK